MYTVWYLILGSLEIDLCILVVSIVLDISRGPHVSEVLSSCLYKVLNTAGNWCSVV